MRRFLNVVVGDGGYRGIKWLHRVNLQRQSLFFNPAPPEPAAAVDDGGGASSQKKKKTTTKPACIGGGAVRLPHPTVTFAPTPSVPSNVHCFPLTEKEIVCVDQCGRAALYDCEEPRVETMPRLHGPNGSTISLSTPNTMVEGSRSLYIMKTTPGLYSCNQFEAFIQEQPRLRPREPKIWQCQTFRVPLDFYTLHEKFGCGATKSTIKSYAVLGGGSHICFSLEDLGTYCFDTVSHAWSHAGDWTLPFYGKAEYVPELKLWFGLSADEPHRLCAADLSDMDSGPPELVVGPWEELEPQEGWVMDRDQGFVVHLGSGKFCIARSCRRVVSGGGSYSDNESLSDAEYLLMTGVEVVPHGYQLPLVGCPRRLRAALG